MWLLAQFENQDGWGGKEQREKRRGTIVLCELGISWWGPVLGVLLLNVCLPAVEKKLWL